MKIYFVAQSFTPNSGSFSGFIEEVAKYYAHKGYTVTIICGNRYNKQKKREVTDYAEIFRHPTVKLPIFSNVVNAMLFVFQIRKYRFTGEEFIIANGEAALGLKPGFILRAPDQPAPIYLKNLSLAKTNVLSRIFRWIHINILFMLEKIYIKKAKSVICSSSESKDLLMKYYGKKPFFIPHSGVKFKTILKSKRQRLYGRNMLFVSSNLERMRKGMFYLEEALPRLFLKYPDLNLIHIGEKYNWNLPKEFLPRIKSKGRLSWEHTLSYYRSADFLIMSSIHEMFPNVVIEAILAGLPVLCSDIQGASEYVQHKKTGYIFKRTDINQLVQGVDYILSDYIKLKKNSQRISKKFKVLDYSTYCERLNTFITTGKPVSLLPR